MLIKTHLIQAMFDVEKVEALMYAFEHTFLDLETVPGEYERENLAANAFYALYDLVKYLKEDLEKLAGDETVVDAIYAVNDVKRCN